MKMKFPALAISRDYRDCREYIRERIVNTEQMG